MTLDQVKKYLRVTYDDDDSYLEELIRVAEGYLEDGITDYKEKLKNQLFCREITDGSIHHHPESL